MQEAKYKLFDEVYILTSNRIEKCSVIGLNYSVKQQETTYNLKVGFKENPEAGRFYEGFSDTKMFSNVSDVLNNLLEISNITDLKFALISKNVEGSRVEA